MHRRDLLARATSGFVMAAAGMSGVLTTTSCTTEAPFPVATLEQPALLAVLGDAQIRAIGTRYLADTPAERTAAALVAAIAGTARNLRAWPWSPAPTMESLINADFLAERTVHPDGWILAVTEVRQCALYALRRA